MNPLIVLGFVIAAGLGGAARFLVARAASDRWRIPIGTLAVNLGGSFALGLIADWRGTAATIVGVAGLGALTTFSTFSREVVVLAEDDPAALQVYAALSLVGGIGLAWVGLQLGG